MIWQDYEKLAAKLAWQRIKINPSLEFDDLMGQAHLAFCAAHEKWDPAKGKFSTLFTWWCRHYMGQVKKPLNHLPLDEAANKEEMAPSPDDAIEFQEKLKSLGREASAVVNMVLNSSDELANFTYKTVVQPTQQTIMAYFRACGWSRYRVEQAFGEIKEMLAL